VTPLIRAVRPDIRSPAIAATMLLFTGAALTVLSLAQLPLAVTKAPFWVMAALAVAASAVTFIPTSRRTLGLVVCPSLCFTFVILLCWGLGPAIVVQTVAVAVIAFRLGPPARRRWRDAALSAARYAAAFGAAYVVLLIGKPDPLHATATMDLVRDTAAVVGATLVFLVAYGLVVSATVAKGPPAATDVPPAGRSALGLPDGDADAGARGGWWPRLRGRLTPLRDPALHTVALMMMSPVLAVAGHVSLGFVPLVIMPLYAVERMARLSDERRRAAFTDSLTGLANRAGLQTRFQRLSAEAGPAGSGLALLLLDLDGFKYVNDALGHETGDQLLIAVADRLRAGLPPDAVACRLGGDEFAVLLPAHRDPERAGRAAERISAAVDGPVQLGGLEVEVTAAVGVAVAPGHGTDFTTLMRHADVAMYDAKRDNRSVAVYRPGADRRPHRLAVLNRVRQAILTDDRRRIRVHYQPQADLATGQIVGVEALLRWTDPDGLAGSPAELLSIIEHTPVMHLLTDWVIDDAVSQAGRWRAAGLELRTSINISIRDLFRDDLVERLGRRLAEHRVPARLIQLEITESALMADPGRAMRTVLALRELGVGLALDDFGTGYSSLQHLRMIPLDEIKIDRSFVAGMATNQHDNAIVSSVIALARTLGLRTVAEGIEDERTRRLLRGAGCSLLQGYLLARAMPPEEIASLVRAVARERLGGAPGRPGGPTEPIAALAADASAATATAGVRA
jgi:diguanylate cyclase